MEENARNDSLKVKIATSVDDLRDVLMIEKKNNKDLQEPNVLETLYELIDIASYSVFHFEDLDNDVKSLINEALDYAISGKYIRAKELIEQNNNLLLNAGLLEDTETLLKVA